MESNEKQLSSFFTNAQAHHLTNTLYNEMVSSNRSPNTLYNEMVPSDRSPNTLYNEMVPSNQAQTLYIMKWFCLIEPEHSI